MAQQRGSLSHKRGAELPNGLGCWDPEQPGKRVSQSPWALHLVGKSQATLAFIHQESWTATSTELCSLESPGSRQPDSAQENRTGARKQPGTAGSRGMLAEKDTTQPYGGMGAADAGPTALKALQDTESHRG